MRGHVLLFGGSFDPPHRGHLALLAAALAALRPERAYVLPAFRSPLKGLPNASAAERLALIHAALAGLPARLQASVRVDAWELRRGRVSYTYEALRRLARRHPGARISFLAGSDALEGFSRWRRPREVARRCRFLVGLRPGAARPSASPGAREARRGWPPHDFLPGRFPAVSAREARGRLLAGLDSSALLPRRVADLIERRGLYGRRIHRALARELPPERYRHTLEVARMALELARLHGLDPERAALAGLLHDCGRTLDLAGLSAYARRRRLPVPLAAETARRAPLLLHAYVSADLAARRFGVADPGVLSAVAKHTLGGARMSALDRLLYVADACSADRAFPQADELRLLARSDLDGAYLAAVRVKLEYVLREGSWLHPAGAALWNRALEGP